MTARDWLYISCDTGHHWVSVGGRACPYDLDTAYDSPCGNRSQVVFECSRCPAVDFGDPGGPGHADCLKHCGLERLLQEKVDEQNHRTTGVGVSEDIGDTDPA